MKFSRGDPPISSWSGALLGELRETVLSSLFPPRCPICDRVLSPGERICPSCVPCIRPMQRPRCLKCGRGIASEEAELCENCRRRRFSFDLGFILLEYSDELSESIARIKISWKAGVSLLLWRAFRGAYRRKASFALIGRPGSGSAPQGKASKERL